MVRLWSDSPQSLKGLKEDLEFSDKQKLECNSQEELDLVLELMATKLQLVRAYQKGGLTTPMELGNDSMSREWNRY